MLTLLVPSVVSAQTVPPVLFQWMTPTYTVGSSPYGAITSDFNRDGRTDLAVNNSGDTTVSVLLGNGDGTFQPAVAYFVGDTPNFIAAGDLNRDTFTDLVVVLNVGAVGVLLGNGNGSFQPVQTFGPVDTSSFAVGVGDFNGDGKPDITVTRSFLNGGTGAQILFGNGDGTFQPAVEYVMPGYAAYSLAVADLNADGKDDLIVAAFSASGLDGVGDVLLSQANGTFGSSLVIPMDFAWFVAPGDFNGDGIADVVFATTDISTHANRLESLFGGTFARASSPSANSSSTNDPYFLAVGDLNGDRKPDLAIVNYASTNLFLNNGDGTFQPGASYSVDSVNTVAPGDFDGDGLLDLAVVRSCPGRPDCTVGSVSMLLNRSANTPAGSDVSVTSATGPVVTFGDVSAAGTTTVTTGSSGLPAPTGFYPGESPTYYEITTTAVVSGPIVVCFNASWVTDQAQFDLLRVLHGEGGVLVDRTVLAPDTPAPNFATRTICARTNSLSPFTLARRTYAWSGILQPVNADGTSIFKKGSTVPVKFSLAGGSAGITNLQAKLYVAKISNNVVGTELEGVSTAAATTGSLFRFDSASGQYVFNWGTGGQTVGTYQLRIEMPDGVKRMVTLSLK
jgi:hypothetical protein